ncbi:MAG: T9SS type A sorting domain-containing protein [Ignavibacteria bacterium]|nr:T9SS type A sorting domain-containing protein [Ignavibacteria bacterium]MBK7447552.1 T9SS type A sorting domain-containing protein [Ignavibacteria bacterium]MBK8381940.1 T9SS type A sorting domain-containing protein [Ignavibacteria bacterium]MBK9406281.1 T9SS type A sorting domain-containing protein [Ignavibacteria bacterium]MBL0106196.1 T9SS type A sorting domain-containing protein [Ignavibacteria bacterium]
MKIYFLILVMFVLVLSLKANDKDVNNNRIANYTAVIKNGEVNLNWKIDNPVNLYKFKIEIKKAGTENYNFVADILFANFRKKEVTDTMSSYNYFYSHTPEENGVYYYKLSAFDNFNRSAISEELKIGITEVPEFKLHQNNPNPFNPSTVITFSILVPTNVKIEVYSLTGKYVDLLVDGFKNPGTYSIEFNTSKYSDISSGIYFYKLETNYSSDIKKMIFAK